jgi:hypothetical protein
MRVQYLGIDIDNLLVYNGFRGGLAPNTLAAAIGHPIFGGMWSLLPVHAQFAVEQLLLAVLTLFR